MKYFTRDLIVRYGSEDKTVFLAANEEWEQALDAYTRYLDSIAPQLPERIRDFTQLLLHDAIVWSIARQGKHLIMVLHKDIPPRDLVILTYELIAEPIIDKEALPVDQREEVMDFRYDEFELIHEGGRQTYVQTILFGNGWEMVLRFADVKVTLAEPVYAVSSSALNQSPQYRAAQSA